MQLCASYVIIIHNIFAWLRCVHYQTTSTITDPALVLYKHIFTAKCDMFYYYSRNWLNAITIVICAITTYCMLRYANKTFKVQS